MQFKKSTTLIALSFILIQACGVAPKRVSEPKTEYERWLRFNHFSDSSWDYESARDFVNRTNFNHEDYDLITREEWGARPPRTTLDDIGYVDGIVIHHSLTSDRVTPQSIQDYHMDHNRWDDVGYHFLIARDNDLNWQLFEGRRLPSLGAHAGRGSNGENLNIGKIGIVMVGNFGQQSSENPEGWPSTAPEYRRQPEQEVIRILGALINDLIEDYPTIDSIYTHRTGPFNINPEGGICPGSGAVNVFDALKNKFHLQNKIFSTHSFY